MNSERKNDTRGLLGRIKRMADKAGGNENGYLLEMHGREQIYVYGCRRIIKYTKEEIILSVKDFYLSVKGLELVCLTYYDRAVGIEGCICNIDIGDSACTEALFYR